MRSWTLLLAGLCVWAAHFFTLYAIASTLPGRPEFAAWPVLGATAAAAVADVLILKQALARTKLPDPTDAWIARVAAAGAGLSLLAVAWQAAPALLA